MKPRNKYLRVTFLLLIPALLFLWLELSGSDQKYAHDQQSDSEALEQAVQFFDELLYSLNSASEEIKLLISDLHYRDEIRPALLGQAGTELFWGLSLFKNSERWFWEGNELNLPRTVTHGNSEPLLTITAINNVILLLRYHHFDLNDDSYTLLTAMRLQQSVDIPLLKDLEFDLTDHPLWEGNPRVVFRFFEPDPAQVDFRTLEIPGSGRVGVVYLQNLNSDADSAESAQKLHRIIFFVLFGIILYIAGGSLDKKRIPLTLIAYHCIRLLFLLLVWLLIYLSEVHLTLAAYAATAWELHDHHSAELIIFFLLNSLFIFLIFITSVQIIDQVNVSGRNWSLSSIFGSAFLFGFLSLLLILFFTQSVDNLLLESTIPLLYLDISPDPLSFLFYLFSLVMFTGSFGIIFSVSLFLNRIYDQNGVIILLFSSLGLLLSALATGHFFSISITFQKLIFYYLLFLSVISLSGTAITDWTKLSSQSGFRKLTLLAVSASTVTYLLIFSATMHRVDRDLLQEVSGFTDDASPGSSEILFGMLQSLENSLSYFSVDDVENENPFLIRQFQRTVAALIEDDRRGYSFHFRILKPNDIELTSFSTSLERPVWSSFFNTNLMRSSHRGEQLRYETNRPIIWGRPANLSERYISLDRGWIPIFDPDQTSRIIAWVAGEVYRERFDYQRPLRAMLTAAEDSGWRQSIFLSEFTGDRLTRTALKGMYHNQPQFNRLSSQKREAAAMDSVLFITNHTESGRFREILVNSGERQITIASTPYPGINHHLFSYFRLQIVLIFFSLFSFTLISALGFPGFAPFGRNHRFRDRLVDGLIMTTILFLTVLIYATQFTVGKQNERNVERELLGNLSVAADILREKGPFSDSTAMDDVLGEITKPLNADLILFRGAQQISSTTPQIFYHFLIPSVMPFNVYNQLFYSERSFYLDRKVIGSREMLIGYRLLPGPSGEPVGAIAIPTFIESPVYEEQLLSTTSTLFVMYLIIFSLFIAGTMFLSGQLTKPLRSIQTGLNKISGGDLKARVAVTSNDEIGSLAEAYNEMVQKLDVTQQELMRAEREAAWKEMAQQVAHEIKNPLTPMKLSLQHLQRQLEASPEKVAELKPVIERTAANIIEQIESLNKIASDFSAFARPVRDPFRLFSLPDLIHALVTLFSHHDQISFVKNIPEKDFLVEGAEEDLRRAFINVLKNAVESLRKTDSEITITLTRQKDRAVVSIKDNGSGIEEGDREKIFMPKFSTKSSGTGLGLAITRQIIEAHKGDIRFESETGHGTEFIITLPLLQKNTDLF
ncbi:MAG: sensor histidine kinase [Balneolaceae bacterium]|nr:MAG: sensor histidine kinase [Balneolaceae bacterium]